MEQRHIFPVFTWYVFQPNTGISIPLRNVIHGAVATEAISNQQLTVGSRGERCGLLGKQAAWLGWWCSGPHVARTGRRHRKGIYVLASGRPYGSTKSTGGLVCKHEKIWNGRQCSKNICPYVVKYSWSGKLSKRLSYYYWNFASEFPSGWLSEQWFVWL